MKHRNLLLKMSGLIALAAFTSCTTFKGDIPLEVMAPAESYISPINQDGIMDSFTLSLQIPDLNGLKIAGYTIAVTAEDDDVIFLKNEGQMIPAGKTKISGRKTPVNIPQQINWTGIDNDGSWVSDGVYYMTLRAWDFDGNTGELDPIAIIVDNTPPSAEIILPYMIFSPNKDGNQDVLDMYQTSSAEDEWTGEFLDKEGQVVFSQTWPGLAPEFHWNGLDSSGSKLDDGEYSYRLSSTDRAGNSFTKEISDLSIESRSYDIQVTSGISAFSPNRDGILDTVTFSLDADKPDQIKQTSFVITNEAGEIKRVLTPPSTSFPMNILFDGKDKNSKFLPEGHYYGVFSVMYANGNNPVLNSAPIRLDLTPPQAVVSRDLRVFSPDGDGRKDDIAINQTTSIEGVWDGQIKNSGGAVIRSYQWQKRAIAFNWDGKNDAGQPAPDDEYFYTLQSTDLAGNTASYRTTAFFLDTKPTPVTVRNTAAAFSPNNDGINDFMEFTLNPVIKEGIINWNYTITDSLGNPVYEFGVESENIIPEKLSWAGMDQNGLIVEGNFSGTLFVEYEKGNQANASIETPFVLDLTAPTITHSVAPIPFSPDVDGFNDMLEIRVSVLDDQGVKHWSASILDPTGQTFLNIPSSRFTNGLFKWNGLSQKNELVQSASDYKLLIKAEDLYGNISIVNEIIPIDILVLKDGDKLKISISSIYFKPFTADYLDVSPELQAKNIATLDKLSVILKKYSAYNINLEGHAVRIHWNKPNQWQTEESNVLLPLSSKRAESIRDALIQRGIDSKRMSTSGIGGYNPLIPHSDYVNRWKNRRVEFILIK